MSNDCRALQAMELQLSSSNIVHKISFTLSESVVAEPGRRVRRSPVIRIRGSGTLHISVIEVHALQLNIDHQAHDE